MEERKTLIKIEVELPTGDRIRSDTGRRICPEDDCRPLGEPIPFLVKSSETIDQVVQGAHPYSLPGSANAYCASDFYSRFNRRSVTVRQGEEDITCYAVQFYCIEER